MSDFDQVGGRAGPGGEFPNPEPKRIKVFGVMHIVFGALGFLHVLWGLVSVVFPGIQESMMTLSSAGAPEGMYELQMDLVKKLAPYTWISLLLIVVVAGLMMRAGIGLVKQKRGAVGASNLYAWVSLATKLVMLLLFFAVVQPAYDALFEGMIDSTAPQAKAMLGMMRILTAATGVLGPVLMSIYPILALVMLNKPVVKNYFSGLGR